jgi:hypothetical protein
MTIGTAIVIVMLLYLLDKRGLLKRAAGIVALISFLALVWIFAEPRYKQWKVERYIRHHAEMEASLIAKYHGAIIRPPDPPPGYKLDSVTNSVRLDELEPADPNKVVVYLDDICKEPQWEEMQPWERGMIVSKIMPKWDVFDRVRFENRCPDGKKTRLYRSRA